MNSNRLFESILFWCLFLALVTNSVARPSAAEDSEFKYTYYEVGSAVYIGEEKRFLHGGERIYDLRNRYLFSEKDTFDLATCSHDESMMCFLDPLSEFSLYVPRKKGALTTWKAGNQTYIFEGWKRLPFLPSKSFVGVVHAFDNEMLEGLPKNGAHRFPQATYYIDKETRLLGMIRYSMVQDEAGDYKNNISEFYWVRGKGLPLNDF